MKPPVSKADLTLQPTATVEKRTVRYLHETAERPRSRHGFTSPLSSEGCCRSNLTMAPRTFSLQLAYRSLSHQLAGCNGQSASRTGGFMTGTGWAPHGIWLDAYQRSVLSLILRERGKHGLSGDNSEDDVPNCSRSRQRYTGRPHHFPRPVTICWSDMPPRWCHNSILRNRLSSCRSRARTTGWDGGDEAGQRNRRRPAAVTLLFSSASLPDPCWQQLRTSVNAEAEFVEESPGPAPRGPRQAVICRQLPGRGARSDDRRRSRPETRGGPSFAGSPLFLYGLSGARQEPNALSWPCPRREHG